MVFNFEKFWRFTNLGKKSIKNPISKLPKWIAELFLNLKN